MKNKKDKDMKFKHLLLASLAVCAFASCSDDNAPKEIEYKDFDAQFSISAVPMNEITKASTVTDGEADETGTINEQFVKTLTAYVFNSVDGSYAGMGTATATGNDPVDRVENILVKVKAEKAGDISTSSKFKVVLLANVKLESTPTNLSDLTFFTGIGNYSFEGVKGATEYLPMGSSVFEITNLAAGLEYNNWVKGSSIEYTKKDSGNKLTPSNGSVANAEEGDKYDISDADRIALTRYVARVQLESLSAEFTNGNEKAEFKLTRVHLANVSNASKYYGDDFQYVIGGTEGAGVYDQKNAFMRGDFDFDRVDYYLAAGEKLSSLTKDYTDENIIIRNNETIQFNDATISDSKKTLSEKAPEMAQLYAFELNGFKIGKDNGTKAEGETADIYTSLVLEGEWTNAGVQGAKRYFRIPIKHTTETYGVKRNYIYKVNATLTGEGTDNPDKSMLNTFVSFSISVQDWHVKKQVEDDVNS